MIELSKEIIAIAMLGGVLVGVLTGYPLALPIGFVSLFQIAIFSVQRFVDTLLFEKILLK